MLTIDTLIYTQDLPKRHDDLSKAHFVHLSLGGKGLVTALTCWLLQADVTTFSLVGSGDDDSNMMSSLLPGGFRKTYLMPWLTRGNRTWIGISETGETHTFVQTGKILPVPIHEIDTFLLNYFSEIDLLYVSAEAIRLLKRVVVLVPRLRIPVVTNISSALLSDQSLSLSSVIHSLFNISDVILMNKQESENARRLLGWKSWSKAGERVKAIIITDGNRGGYFSTRPFRMWESYKAIPLQQIKCPVGAGDTFNGAFLVSRFILKRPLKESCVFASKVAARKLKVPGSSLCFRTNPGSPKSHKS